MVQPEGDGMSDDQTTGEQAVGTFDPMGWSDLRRTPWQWFLAFFRLNQQAVCELSRSKGRYDYHDYPDTDHGQPSHFETLICQHCGKGFWM